MTEALRPQGLSVKALRYEYRLEGLAGASEEKPCPPLPAVLERLFG